MLNNNSLYDVKKQTEQLTQTLSQNFQFLNKMIQLLPLPCVILDKNGKVFLTNNLEQDFFNQSTKTENVRDIFEECLSHSDFELFSNWVLAFFSDTTPIKTLRLKIFKEDLSRNIGLAGKAILIGDILYLLVLITDFSDVLDESTLSNDSESLKEALVFERNKSEFYLNISHDIRTPLNVILGTVQLTELTLKNPTPPVMGHDIMNRRLNVIKHNCYRLLKLVNNLIDISRLDTGYKTVELCNCDIVSQINEIVSSITEYAENKSLSLNFKSNVDELIIACDIDKIERIMFNLLSNAIKFSNENGIIEVSILSDKKWVTISVKDNGIGIPQNKLKSIFKRFKQVNDDLSSRSGGSGIGLSLVKSLVEMLKGSICVESSPEGGSTFTVRLLNKKLHTRGINECTKLPEHLNVKPDIERIKIEFSDL